MLQSRKFKLALFNAVIAIVLLLVAQFAPAYEQFARQLIVAITPLVMVLILGIAIEDAGQKAAGEDWRDKVERNKGV